MTCGATVFMWATAGCPDPAPFAHRRSAAKRPCGPAPVTPVVLVRSWYSTALPSTSPLSASSRPGRSGSGPRPRPRTPPRGLAARRLRARPPPAGPDTPATAQSRTGPARPAVDLRGQAVHGRVSSVDDAGRPVQVTDAAVGLAHRHAAGQSVAVQREALGRGGAVPAAGGQPARSMTRAGRGEAVSGAALGAAGGNGVGNHGDKVALRGSTDGAALPGVFDEALPGRLRHLRHVPARRRPASPRRVGAGVARFAPGAVEDRGVRGARRARPWPAGSGRRPARGRGPRTASHQVCSAYRRPAAAPSARGSAAFRSPAARPERSRSICPAPYRGHLMAHHVGRGR